MTTVSTIDYLRQRFSPFVKNLVVLRGGMSAGDRKMADAAMRVSDDQERLILATGRYVGEGFDDARLDTLFLTMPIAWKGHWRNMSAVSIACTTEKGKKGCPGR
jgi:hypothetical protein